MIGKKSILYNGVIAFLLVTPTLLIAQNQISPNGRLIVDYEKNESGNAEIYVYKIDGTTKFQLTNHPFDDYNPEWVGNSNQVVFYRKDPNQNQADLYSVSFDNSKELQLTKNEFYEGDPSYSPDGRSIAFNSNKDGDYEVYVLDTETNSSIQLTFNDSSDWTPDWSPDGKELVFVSNMRGSFELYLIDSNGNNLRQITQSGTENYAPDWSPDGKNIAYFRRDGTDMKFDLFVYSFDEKKVTNLTNTKGWNEFIVGWMPMPDALVFSCEKHDGFCKINIQNKTTELLFSK